MSHDSLERITPTQENLSLFFKEFPDHQQRYEFAMSLLSPEMSIADMACGVGYGSWLLSKKVNGVVGVDISNEALSHARQHFDEKNISFIHGDEYGYESKFDAVVSFETIEHMDEAAGDEFLKKIKKSLKQNGILIMSTPINKTNKKINVTEFHLREYDDFEFQEKLRNAGFKIVEMYGQGSPFHEKLYGTNGSTGLFKFIKLGVHRVLPQSIRNLIKKNLMGNPNDGLKISSANWRSAMIQIAICKVA
jgi:SAM-dependent methyltransferase